MIHTAWQRISLDTEKGMKPETGVDKVIPYQIRHSSEKSCGNAYCSTLFLSQHVINKYPDDRFCKDHGRRLAENTQEGSSEKLDLNSTSCIPKMDKFKLWSSQLLIFLVSTINYCPQLQMNFFMYATIVSTKTVYNYLW